MYIANTIRNLFYPAYYSMTLPTEGAQQLCLLRRQSLGGHALVVSEYKAEMSIEAQVYKARCEIRRATHALWCINKIGLYLVIVDVPPTVTVNDSDTKVDLTGFHAVILQGVHIIDSHLKHTFNHSPWSSGHVFGGAGYICAHILHAVGNNVQSEKAR